MKADFDIKRARAETRACEEIVHFNNAGASLMPISVSDALHGYLHQEERIGGYETAVKEGDALDNFYTASAKLLNCEADEIAYMENATRAWDMAFYSFKFKSGDRILTTIAEYGSNVVAYNQQSKRYGVEVIFVPNDKSGQIDIDALENLIDERVKLISITHIPTGGGLVNPAAEVGKIAKAAGIPYLLDSCQGVGQIPLDVEELGCDILCGTGRKYLRGPRGTGLLYVRQEMIEKLEPPLLDQHAARLISSTEYEIRRDAKRFEGWEQYFAGKAALGTAIDYALSWDIAKIRDRVYDLAEKLREKLSDIDGVHVTDEGIEKCGIVTFRTDQKDVDELKKLFAAEGINVSTPKGSGSLVSFQQRGLKELVRASLHYYNTEEEIDYFITTLQGILQR
ncbi:MAG: aminotransferase class V-fold PLP-dependent enzyme [Anaerolineae bacterium]|jgi:cysteine desulfurase / selenocysteine lyase|nr:aminotransferase class V-fold PLP-dependent enzyme [Anaerolineae bacterium]MBT7073442.1 aminotransferase class V-fold PLP-dependent enzyme [Anaerolineae bacterium]MBT7781815.1 aminotransferase class V-fold PLP-dependent enzyme [Anaerolineae bacterium]